MKKKDLLRIFALLAIPHLHLCAQVNAHQFDCNSISAEYMSQSFERSSSSPIELTFILEKHIVSNIWASVEKKFDKKFTNNFINLAPGLYRVTIPTSDALDTDETNVKLVSNVVEIDECISKDDQRFKISISPNPASNTVRIDMLNAINCEKTLKIVNPQGIIFQQIAINSENILLQIDVLAPGPYLVHVVSCEQSVSKLLIVK